MVTVVCNDLPCICIFCMDANVCSVIKVCRIMCRIFKNQLSPTLVLLTAVDAVNNVMS